MSFVKRTNGEVRNMIARLGVTKHLSGGGAKYSFASKNLLSVWDVQARSYRCVPLDAILSLKCGSLSLTEDGRLYRGETHELEQDRREQSYNEIRAN